MSHKLRPWFSNKSITAKIKNMNQDEERDKITQKK